MEEQRISLASILLTHPDLDIDAEVEEFRRRLQEAIRETNPSAEVEVTRHEDWLSFSLVNGTFPPDQRDELVRILYEVKAAWLNELIVETNQS